MVFGKEIQQLMSEIYEWSKKLFEAETVAYIFSDNPTL